VGGDGCGEPAGLEPRSFIVKAEAIAAVVARDDVDE
jgi:hypothetical protein